MKRRILAWIALIVFLVLFINLLFFHYRSTETLVIMLFYVLFLIIKNADNEAELNGNTIDDDEGSYNNIKMKNNNGVV